MRYEVAARSNAMEVPSCMFAVGQIRLQAASGSRSHATDIKINVLEEYLESLPQSPERTLAAFLALTGIRGQDALRLKKEQIAMSNVTFSVDIRVAKNRRRSSHSVTLKLSRKLGEILWRPRLLNIVRDGLHDNVFFPTSLIPLRRCLLDGGMTAYSLRRNFIQRVLELCTDHKGIIDYDKAILFTLHNTSTTLRSSYELRAQDDNRTE